MDREEHFVAFVPDELGDIGLLHAGKYVDFVGQFLAVEVEREIVGIVAEGVFDFATDQHEPNDYVGCEDSAWDGHPVEVGVELEREEDDIDPADLINLKEVSIENSPRANGMLGTYCDTVCNWERRIQNTIAANEDFVECANSGV